MAVVFHLFELLILPFQKRLFVLNFSCSSVFCYLTFSVTYNRSTVILYVSIREDFKSPTHPTNLEQHKSCLKVQRKRKFKTLSQNNQYVLYFIMFMLFLTYLLTAIILQSQNHSRKVLSPNQRGQLFYNSIHKRRNVIAMLLLLLWLQE